MILALRLARTVVGCIFRNRIIRSQAQKVKTTQTTFFCCMKPRDTDNIFFTINAPPIRSGKVKMGAGVERVCSQYSCPAFLTIDAPLRHMMLSSIYRCSSLTYLAKSAGPKNFELTYIQFKLRPLTLAAMLDHCLDKFRGTSE